MAREKCSASLLRQGSLLTQGFLVHAESNAEFSPGQVRIRIPERRLSSYGLGQAFCFCHAASGCAASVREACRESYSFSNPCGSGVHSTTALLSASNWELQMVWVFNALSKSVPCFPSAYSWSPGGVAELQLWAPGSVGQAGLLRLPPCLQHPATTAMADQACMLSQPG